MIPKHSRPVKETFRQRLFFFFKPEDTRAKGIHKMRRVLIQRRRFKK